ncbi:hypothetical protein RKD30_004351 [Streptomyces pristinaespiralis]
MDLAWIESEGGPVILVEESLRRLWGWVHQFRL